MGACLWGGLLFAGQVPVDPPEKPVQHGDLLDPYTPYWANVGPASATLAQHQPNMGWICRIFRDADLSFVGPSQWTSISRALQIHRQLGRVGKADLEWTSVRPPTQPLSREGHFRILSFFRADHRHRARTITPSETQCRTMAGSGPGQLDPRGHGADPALGNHRDRIAAPYGDKPVAGRLSFIHGAPRFGNISGRFDAMCRRHSPSKVAAK